MKNVWLLVLACICMTACRNRQQSAEVTNYDLPQIKDSGELVALTLNSSTSYFDYRGEPMGFQYELADQFTRSLGVKLKIKVAQNARDLVHKLLQGEGDLIAYNLPVTKEFKDSVEFCGEDIITHQVLVQRNTQKKKKALNNVTELIGKEVYVKPGKYLERLINLDKELGGGILIHEVNNDSITTEDLIMQVSNGEIDYAICDNDLAKLNKTYYPNLNIDLAVSFDQRASWAVRKTSPLLGEAATKWHQENITSPAYQASSKRYFEIRPEGLSEAEEAVYTLIAGRMLEAFSPCCEKELILMECRLDNMDFRSKSSLVVSPGWRGIFCRKEDRQDDEPETDEGTAVFAEGDTVPVSGFGLSQKKTVPRPPYTEATLLAAMETCGREIADEQAREAVKELGIGTPATRAAIITTLFKRDYIARSGKSIVPTEKGLHIYDAVKDMLVADVSLTGSWEKTLLQIERHTLGPDTFMASITDYTRKATREILNLSLPAAAARTFTCPKCKTGHIIVREKSARCDNKGCGLTVYRRFLNKELTDQHLEQLFSSGSTRLIKGFKGKKGVAFDASVTFDAGFTLTLSFPKNGNGRKRK